MKDNKIKIFHTGDFHLDSPFSGCNVKESDARREALRCAFSAALERAEGDGCDLILIAGDLFDCGYVTAETVARAFSDIEKCGIPVIVSPGNHDPYRPGGIDERSDKPGNLFVFSSPQLTRLDLDGLPVSIHGYAFTSDRIDEPPVTSDVIKLHPTNVDLLLAHADIYSPISKYAPLSLKTLETSGFAYAALGHVHKAEEPLKAGSTTVSYCGFPEGRGFDELGFGSAMEVTVDTVSGDVTARRVTLSTRRYMIESVDVTGAGSINEIRSAVLRSVKEKGYGKETSLRVILTGSVSPDISADVHIDAEEAGLSLLEVENTTSPIYDNETLKNDISLRGALYRRLLPALSSDDKRERAVACEALRLGLAALDGKQLL